MVPIGNCVVSNFTLFPRSKFLFTENLPHRETVTEGKTKKSKKERKKGEKFVRI